ncbi:hypothetical protein L7F22_064187 [Adiantum nelumboides]|nr:hypothetical protein [Adiantum nelumboides]
MKRGYHQRTPQRQQNAEREPRNSNYYGGYYVPAVPSAGGGYAGSYFAPSAYSAPAAGGQMPLYHVSHPSSLHGFTPHPHGFDDVRSSAIHQLPDRDAKERPSDSSDESETGDPMSVCRDRKSGLRKMVPVLPMYENEARKLPPLMFSEVSSMPTCLPPMALETPRSKAEKAAKVAYERLLTEKRGVTVWKLVQSMLTQLNWDSLEASGLSLHDIPSLQKLTVLEGKINTYIHCHVAVRRITTLHELSQEISENEGVKDFDDLKLGPLSYHPLVCQYFAFQAGVQVCKISTEDVLSHLSNYMNTHLGNIQLDDFLSFMSKARSLPSPQHLGVRLQSLG